MRIKVSIPFGDQPNSTPTEIELEGNTIYEIDELIKKVEKIKESM
ncbi:MAG: hypothetical protein ACR2F1_12840 [Nitrososphaeraceae archaeon]